MQQSRYIQVYQWYSCVGLACLSGINQLFSMLLILFSIKPKQVLPHASKIKNLETYGFILLLVYTKSLECSDERDCLSVCIHSSVTGNSATAVKPIISIACGQHTGNHKRIYLEKNLIYGKDKTCSCYCFPPNNTVLAQTIWE